MKKWAVLICVVVLSTTFYLYSSREQSIPHHNLIDTKISQYSDKNITQNAIATDPEFKNLAFDDVPKPSLLSDAKSKRVTEYFLGTSTLEFAVVVPDFYDEKDGFTPKFFYNGNEAYAFKHLLNVLDKRPNSSII